jgi:hypothetical protein
LLISLEEVDDDAGKKAETCKESVKVVPYKAAITAEYRIKDFIGSLSLLWLVLYRMRVLGR